MKKIFFSFFVVLLSATNFLSQTTAPSLTVIAAPNSQFGWIYFKNPNTVDPNTVFTVYASNFGLGSNDQMQFVKNETDALGVTHTYYNHYYKNTKIDVGQNTVHSRNGKANLVNGHICIGLNMSVIPTISSASAITFAKNYVNATTYMWEDTISEQNLRILKNDVNATYYPNPELLIAMIGADLPFVPSNFRLAYKVDVNSKVPYGVKAIYVDANSGNIIKEASLIHGGAPLTVSPNTCAPTLANTMYSGPQVIPSYYTTNPISGAYEYKLYNPCKGGGIITKLYDFNSVNDVYTNTPLTWGTGSTIEHLTKLQWATDKYYDFLLSTFNRQSIDNNNALLTSVSINDGPRYVPGNLIYMPVGWAMSDMIGHEWGHGITEYSMAGGLPTSGEAECISEGISDVWGTTFEFYLEGTNADWLVGEDYSANPYVRDMSDPESRNQADTYMGTNYDATNNNTYENSGVLGYWFYLLSQGGLGQNSFNDLNDPNNLNGLNNFNYNITGVGMAQPTQILYRAYPYLTSSSNYHDLRNATIQATRDLYGYNCPLLKTVADAWDAVGVYDMLFDQNGNPIPNYCLEACVTKTDVSCTSGLNSGTASILIEVNGTGPYTNEWFTINQTYLGAGLSINNLAPGNYFAQVYNNDISCIVQFPFTINDNSNTILAFTTINATCTDGAASVIASGGAYPYTYAWTPINVNLPTPTTAYVENLPAGTYNVTVTDANGCVATGNTVVGQNTINFTIPFNTTVTGMVTWNQALVTVDGQVIVAPGGHLTITGNTRVEISHHADILDPMPFGVARIIVEPGGTLTVAPTVTLTGCGGGTWDGIELWGTGIFNSGAALGNINGQIENADIGIFTSRRPKRNQAIVNNYGGSLLVNGAKFINNKVGIYIPRSSSPFSPAQQIKSSTFKIDGTSYYKNDFSLANNVEPIHIFAGNNVYVNASSNAMTGGDQYYSSTLKGTGIKCIDCNLIVDNAIGTVSDFTGLAKGIDNQNVFSTNQIVVDGTTFTDNQEAIYMQGSNYAEITNNIFNVPAPVAPFPRAYGLFAVNSSGFVISGNTINPFSSNTFSYGMVIEESGTIGGEVFKNTFNGVGIGLQMQYNNSNLKVGCNNFNNPILYSMAIVGSTSSLKWQGKFNGALPDCSNSSFPAGNEWNYSGCAIGTDKNIFTNNISFNYETHSNTNTQPICTPSAWFSANVSPYICGIAKNLGSCLQIFPELPPSPPTTTYNTYYAAIKNLITTYQVQINTLIPQYKNALVTQDGGNTKNLLDAINLSPKKSSGQLKNLLTSSGALSDAVLLATINRNPALPPGILKEILAKQIPLSFAVLTAIENSNLPAGIKNEIYAAQSNTPIYIKASTFLGLINNTKGDIILLESELQRTKLRETKIISKEDLKISLDPTSKMILAQNYATTNQTDSVRLILTQLSTDTTITLIEKQNFISYMNTIVDMLDSNQTVYTVDTLILASVISVSTSNSKISAHANVALKERKKPHHKYLILDIPISNNQRIANTIIDEEINEKTQLANTGNFSLYPNPNKGSFKIELKEMKVSEGLITLTITNLLGQTVLTKTVDVTSNIIDVQDERLHTGIYIVTLIHENKTMGQSKIIIE